MKQIDWAETGKTILLATVVFLAVLFALTMGIAFTVKKGWIALETAEQIVMMLMAILSFVLCLLCSGKIRHGRVIVCLTAAAAMGLGLLFMKTVFFAGREVGGGKHAILLFAGALLASLLSARRRQRR